LSTILTMLSHMKSLWFTASHFRHATIAGTIRDLRRLDSLRM
jgi:hypothetical protein